MLEPSREPSGPSGFRATFIFETHTSLAASARSRSRLIQRPGTCKPHYSRSQSLMDRIALLQLLTKTEARVAAGEELIARQRSIQAYDQHDYLTLQKLCSTRRLPDPNHSDQLVRCRSCKAILGTRRDMMLSVMQSAMTVIDEFARHPSVKGNRSRTGLVICRRLMISYLTFDFHSPSCCRCSNQ